MFKKSFLFVVSFLLLVMIAFPTATFAYSKTSSNPTFTKEQLKEIDKAQKKTLQLAEKWNQRKAKKYYGDKTDSKLSSKSNVSTDVTVSSSYTGRPGVFYITLDGKSSSSLFSWAGGHAGMVYNTYYVVESFGNKDSSSNGVHFWPNDWTTRYSHFEARTTYGTTIEEDALAAEKAASYEGKPYNYNFFYINQDSSFYCSQLVWYSFYKLYNIDLNDGWAVWPVDLTESSNAYLIYSQ